MTKKKSVFVCSQCGAQQPRWLGRCPDCSAWNSFHEELVAADATGLASPAFRAQEAGRAASGLTPLTEVQHQTAPRVFCGIPELDRVLGGGLVAGSLLLLSGDPGVGKSTLLLQALHGLAQRGFKVLYASGEESNQQVKLRADRLNAAHPNILITNETDLGVILQSAKQARPQVLVIDSIQTVYHSEVASSPGSVTQVRECTARLLEHAKTQGVTTWIVGHVTKEGNIAGPRVLEHLVDTVLYLEGDATSGFRILRAVKNRFGSTGEIGVFAMHASGLADVANPSALFLEGHRTGVEGSAVAVSVEGTRPLLVEVQALVGKSTFTSPRRLVTGLDNNRFAILVAVLEKRAGLYLGTNDIYANVAGGLRLSEPALDLAVAAAVASSLLEKPFAGKFAFFGEVGLSGEVRATTHALERVQEAQKLGFERIYMPSRNYRMERDRLMALATSGPQEIQLFPVESVSEIVFPDRQ